MTVDWDSLEEGRGPAPRTLEPVTRTDFVRWMGAVADTDSPIHFDDAAARAQDYPSVIGPGMLQAGFLADYATDWLGAANVRSFRVRFTAVVFPGDRLTCSGHVLRKFERNGDRMVEVELECKRSNGEAAVRGSATFLVPREK